MARLKTAILISGRGSNMQALIDACRTPDAVAEIALVLANNPNAGGLAYAAAAGIPAAVVDHRAYPDRAAFDAELNRRLNAAGIEFVCLAGFMRLLTRGFIEAWRDRMINIHPSLLPAFPGLDTHRRALDAGVRFAGCTVHFVRYETDTGPIVVQAAVPVRADDTPESLAARVLAAEHQIYPQALRWIAAGRVRVVGERAVIAGQGELDAIAINPPP
ncbi:MAG TPA: phosphoribosylglycinamide formyltransferase [Methylomirabilota bacterium]|nr:phosphoribosylglycinamide formyltransferase [Methylomirabilota bacterium]